MNKLVSSPSRIRTVSRRPDHLRSKTWTFERSRRYTPNTRRNPSSSTSPATCGRSLLLTRRNRRASASPPDSLRPAETSPGRPPSSLLSSRRPDSRASARRSSGTRCIPRRPSHTLSGRPHILRPRRPRPPQPRRRPGSDGRSPVRTLRSQPIARRRPRHASTHTRCGPASPEGRRRRQPPRHPPPRPTWKKLPRHRSEQRVRPRTKPPASNRSLLPKPRRHRPPLRHRRPSQHNPRCSPQNNRKSRPTGSTALLLVNARSRPPPRQQHPRRIANPRRPNTPRNPRRPPRPATFHCSEEGTP